jgi:MFS family permease
VAGHGCFSLFGLGCRKTPGSEAGEGFLGDNRIFQTLPTERSAGFFVFMNPAQPTLIASLRGLPRPVWILFAGTFLNKFGAFVIPFLSLYLTSRGFSIKHAGVAMGAYGVGHFLACLVGGHLADSLGRRPTIALSMFSTAVVMLLLPFAESFPAILTLTMLAGLTGELYRPASSALLADLIPQGQRIRAFAAYRMAFNAGWAFGPATAGLLAKYSFTWLFIGDAVTSLLYGIIALVALPTGVKAATKEAGWGEAFDLIKKDTRFHQIIISSLLIGLVFFQMVSTLGLHLTHIGYSASTYGLLISMNGLLVVLCELPLTTISQRVGFHRSMIFGYICVGVGFAALGAVHLLPAIVLCMVVFTIGEMLTMPIAVAQIADLAPANMRGRYMGAYGFTWATSLTFAPIMGSTLFAFHPAALWVTCGIIALVAATVIAREPGKSKIAPALLVEARP